MIVGFSGHIHLSVSLFCPFYGFSLSYTFKVEPSATLNATDKLELVDKVFSLLVSCITDSNIDFFLGETKTCLKYLV